jgi:transcriptional regulator with XRE-family HTH domain
LPTAVRQERETAVSKRVVLQERPKESETNVDFAEKVGVHFSMASKLRHGHRAPSLPTLINIRDAYSLPGDELLDASRGGPETFGEYLRMHVFREAAVGAA